MTLMSNEVLFKEKTKTKTKKHFHNLFNFFKHAQIQVLTSTCGIYNCKHVCKHRSKCVHYAEKAGPVTPS